MEVKTVVNKPKEITDWVYPNSFYNKKRSPSCIYIPSKLIMIKIIRACIGVMNPKNLWINCYNK